MQHLHIISHTHWDREWYRTFQQFRLQLVHLVDNLLTILDSDSNYLHFMLDGQTIVLEDYLQMRMANFPRLQKLIQENRILIGPWYILPDEYLVSPEATIRNLLIGKQICNIFGQRMMIGYIPDPFGHISQMPQILRGFQIDTACLWRGVPPAYPTILTWRGADGSEVLLSHLYYGYGNVADWPVADLAESARKLEDAADRLALHQNTSHFLMMRGTDHYEPRQNTPAAIAEYNTKTKKDRQALHSTLPAYFAAVSAEIARENLTLPVIVGELRDPQKAHMLPAVLSARMWIKQRNWYSQTLLERWVEPFSTWAELATRGEKSFLPQKAFEKTKRIVDPGSVIHQAWKLLITNHPHDSICGCSIDETHSDMVSRFDQVDQVGEEICNQSLETLSNLVHTLPDQDDSGIFAAVNVFNASPYPQSGLVDIVLDAPHGQGLEIRDTTGQILPSRTLLLPRRMIESNIFQLSELMDVLKGVASEGRNDQSLVSARLLHEEGLPVIEAEFSNLLMPDQENLAEAVTQIMTFASSNPSETILRAKVFNADQMAVRFYAKDVPALGFATYHVSTLHNPSQESASLEENGGEPLVLENQWLKVEADSQTGCLSILDKRNGHVFEGLNQFLDGGDRGDEYNFCPPEQDRLVGPEPDYFEVETNTLSQRLTIRYNYELPMQLSKDRSSRLEMTERCPLDVQITLNQADPFVDVQVRFDNRVADHRLEVRFPTGLHVDTARYDGHFDVLERKVDLPESNSGWRELPRPEVPQRAFADVSNASVGLMIANQGLPEAAALRETDGSVTLSLTLLRAVGWLSRDDLWTRQGHAGPPLETPEAQVQGVSEFSYRIIPHDGNWQQAALIAQSYQTPLKALVSNLHTGPLTTGSAMAEVSHAEFQITCLKEAENEAGWILRGVNLADHAIDLQIRPGMHFETAALVNLDESVIQSLEVQDGGVSLQVGPKQVRSLFFGITE